MLKYALLLLLLAFSISPMFAQQAAANAVTYHSERCTPRLLSAYEVECGWLRVPEDRSNPQSRMIELAVMIIRSNAENPAPDPLVYLAGGPGGSTLQYAGAIFQSAFEPFAAQRDIIFFDQRGTGQSEPGLYCQNLIDSANALLGREQESGDASPFVELLFDCHADLLSDDINPAMYNSVISAQDLQDLRGALELDAWNLFGISYGTRLALTALRENESGIRSVVLDSVYPPQVDLYSPLVGNGLRSLSLVFRDCAADALCNTRYPDLENTFWELYIRLNENPERIPIQTMQYGDFELVLTGDRLFNWVFNWLYSVPDIEKIPRRIATLAENPRSSGIIRAGLNEDSYVFSVSMGMYLAVQCAEEISQMTPEMLSRLPEDFPQMAGYIAGNFTLNSAIFELCVTWHGLPASAIENDPVSSAVPVLLLAGEYDPITPPAWAEDSAATLDNSYYYLFPGIGHGVVRSGSCGQDIIADFLRDPASTPDSRCIRTLAAPEFVIAP